MLNTQSDEDDKKSKPLILFVAGDRSGVGKSSVCLGILGGLLSMGYRASSLAYIKPCTQCEDTQLISKWCEANCIAHRGIGPVVFYQGFTSECIDEEDHQKGVQDRQTKVKEAVQEIAKGKQIVIVDGVGYPSVGSTCGVSNAQIAQGLGCPVLLVGRAGLGNAIDSFDLNMTYFEHHNVSVLGGIWNNIPEKESYHTYDNCKQYITKYYTKIKPKVAVYGLVKRNESQWKFKLDHEEKEACILRETKAGLAFQEGEERMCQDIIEWQKKFVDLNDILVDLKKFYGQD